MTTNQPKKAITSRDDSEIIGIRLPKNVARDVKQEVARRGIKINRLFLELWDDYQRHQEKVGPYGG